MEKRHDRRSPRIRTRRRGRWVFLFLIAPLNGLVGALATSMVVPSVLITGAILAISGYQIWRIDHPSGSARSEMGWRIRSALTAVAGVAALLVFEVAPVWVGAAVIVLGAIFLVVFALANRNPPPTSEDPDAPEGPPGEG